MRAGNSGGAGRPVSGRRRGRQSLCAALSAGNANENGTTRLVGAAKALGIDIPATLLGRTDEVIE